MKKDAFLEKDDVFAMLSTCSVWLTAMDVITARDGACLISNQMCKMGVTGPHDSHARVLAVLIT